LPEDAIAGTCAGSLYVHLGAPDRSRLTPPATVPFSSTRMAGSQAVILADISVATRVRIHAARRTVRFGSLPPRRGFGRLAVIFVSPVHGAGSPLHHRDVIFASWPEHFASR
jgi:hypothetical protein